MSERTRTALMWILGVAVLGAGIWMLVKDDDGLRVTDVWARSSPMVDGAAAAYMNIQGGAEDDALVSASVAADVAGKVELHETRMVDGRSEEHTSELQSRPHLVCRLLLEKKKTLKFARN